jgi:hypothetical protein
MPELQSFCESPTSPLSVEHMQVDSSATLYSHERSDVVSTPIPPTLTHKLNALSTKELCDLRNSLLVLGLEGRLLASQRDENQGQKQDGQEGEVTQV